MQLTRRRLGAAGLGAGLAACLPRRGFGFDWPDSGRIVCAVMRKGHTIGTATYAFARAGEALTVDIAIDIVVKLGFIPVFHFKHTNTEHWQGTRLMKFDARTDDNGRHDFAAAQWTGTALQVRGSRGGVYTAPANAIGTSYWNPRTLTDPLISTQHGALLHVTLADAGGSRALRADGSTVAAEEYRLTGDMHMNLWYDGEKNWAGLQYYAHDGSVVTYERQTG